MFRLRTWQRAGERLLLDPSLALAFSLALIVAGCGARSGHAPTADARVSAPPNSQFRAALVQPPQVELEADGLPVQRAPLIRRTRLPDDPSEPFSPNYGSQPSVVPQPTDAPAAPPARRDQAAIYASPNVVRMSLRDLPDDLPPDFRERMIVANGLRD
mgnify:CR=1 FL=1